MFQVIIHSPEFDLEFHFKQDGEEPKAQRKDQDSHNTTTNAKMAIQMLSKASGLLALLMNTEECTN